jgi:60 kDa SS-A/Ro ribonucleoprotein
MSTLNSCGKEIYKITDIEHVKRFLSLGTENGTYYIGEKDLVKQCISCIDRVLNSAERYKLLNLVKEYKTKCKKQDTLIYLLASIVTYKVSDKAFLEFRKKGYDLLEFICTNPTMLFMFIHYCKQLNIKNNKSNGWNNLHKRAITNWYNNKDNKKLIYMVTKYKNRCSYEHRDILRLSHIETTDPIKSMIYKYIIKGLKELESNLDPVFDFINEYEKLIHSEDKEVVLSILNQNHNFAWEHIPTQFLNDKDILIKLLPNMPNIALLRNLNRLSRANVLEHYNSKLLILEKLENMKNIHPIQVLITLKTYSSGKGDKGSTIWTPDKEIITKLEILFNNMFNEITQQIDKRVCIALDVSGSMFGTNTVNGADCLCAAEVACALAMILDKSMKHVEIMGFSTNFVKLNISHKNTLNDNLNMIRSINFGETDCSLPFKWALKEQKEFDAFIVITDNETNSNTNTPSKELNTYRENINIPDSKLIVLSTAANNFTIADPNDKNMLDISGFDSSIPDIICQFINNEI